MRVLVIDDEKHIADTLVMILQMSGWEATAAYDGKGALRRLDSFRSRVVISDVIMPGMNGIEVCEAIQSRYPPVTFFFPPDDQRRVSSSMRRRKRDFIGSCWPNP